MSEGNVRGSILVGLREMLERWGRTDTPDNYMRVVPATGDPVGWRVATLADMVNYRMRIAEREARDARASEAAADKMKAAAKKSFELLKRHLTKKQWNSYKKNGYFTVIGNVTGHEYHIVHGCAMNIYRKGRKNLPTRCFCIQAKADFEFYDKGQRYVYKQVLPYGDIMLMQKLSIETDEEEFLRIAVGERATLEEFGDVTRGSSYVAKHIIEEHGLE